MQKDQHYYTELLSAFIDNRLAPGQVAELFNHIGQDPMAYSALLDSAVIRERLMARSQDPSITMSGESHDRVLQKLLQAAQGPEQGPMEQPDRTKQPAFAPTPARQIHLRSFAYAAAAAVLLAFGIYLFRVGSHKAAIPERQNSMPVADVRPGGNKATLTLAGGRVIRLDSAAVGKLAEEGNITVIKGEGGQIFYQETGNANVTLQNTLATPRGGQYQLVLPDGTKVWMNASSSITYPTSFTGNERKVKVAGEAYFEVKTNASNPFIVEVINGPVVQVLGTHFNINAYADEPVSSTTLLEGSVKVHSGNNAVLLKPGQQAQIVNRTSVPANDPQDHSGAGPFRVSDADLYQVLAWKNGSFLFTRTELAVVMRQIARWYDVDVVYENGIPSVSFEGEMKRDLDLSEVLNILRKMEVHCRIEGRKLIVMP